MSQKNLQTLGIHDGDSDSINVIIETPKNSRCKLTYKAQDGLFELSKVLPRGTTFPFNFGFIPSTEGGDGDPLDVLVILDEAVPTGCRIRVRLLGVIEANQTEKGKTERNDRLIAVPEKSSEHEDHRSLKDLHAQLVQEIEHFFIAYNEMANKQFQPIAHHGPRRAEKMVQQAAKRFRRKHRRGRSHEPPHSARKKSKRNSKK